MSKKIVLLCVIISISLANAIYASDSLGYKEGEILVEFAPKPDGSQQTITERNNLLASVVGGTIVRSSKFIPGLSVVKLPENITVENALAALKDANGLLSAQPNYIYKALSTFPNDTYGPNSLNGGEQWALYNIGQTGGISDADIDAPESWDIHTGSNEIIVAVIDSGVDYDHNDLKDNMWINPGEIPGNGIDDDKNDYVDDIYGYDFCNDDGNPMDDYEHGTACAGIVGAIGNNAEGVTGVCWNVKIMALKFQNSDGDGYAIDAIDAIYYAIDMGAKVISSSWGSYNFNLRLREAIQAADANGLLFVAAAGNDNATHPAYPARYPKALAVGATEHTDTRCTYSNYGPELDAMAPSSDKSVKGQRGGLIFWTTDITGSGGYNHGNILDGDAAGNYTKWFGGTSAACPHVAGLAALMLSYNRALTVDDVNSIILSTADDKGATGWDQYYGWGRINAYNAMVEVAQQTLQLNVVDDINDSNCVSADEYITYTISYGNPVNDVNSPIYVGPVNYVIINDYLPGEVNFVSASGPNAVYDSNFRTVTWELETISAGELNSVTLTVRVNVGAERLGTITNHCEIEGDVASNAAETTTPVCYWCGGDIIYVDANADPNGYNNGISWQHAHKDLQDALENARNCDCNQIWVAKGTYKPTTISTDYEANFALVDGAALYGGFDGNETSLSQRNWHTNETILTGDVDDDGIANNSWDVVTATNVTETASIDGFTITKGYYYGIRCSYASPTIKHNKIKDNYPSAGTGDGVYCENNSSANIINCEILNNGKDGIYCSSSSPFISNNIIRNNNSRGIYINNTSAAVSPVVKNNWICNNSTVGIYLRSLDSVVVIRNNTIANNKTYGISRYSTSDVDPNITNCILWDNLYGSFDRTGYTVTYSCIKGGYSGTGNIAPSSPGFVAPDSNNYHLDPNFPSPCIDKGNPSFTGTETDIDGEPRIFDGDYDGNDRVDMGADEFYWSPADFDGNKIVDSFDYAELAAVWLTAFGDQDYNDLCDLQNNNSIDFKDHAVFAGDWLWQAAWTQAEPLQFMNDGMGQGMIQILGLTEGLEATAPAEQQAEQTVTEEPAAEPVDTEGIDTATPAEQQLAEQTVTEVPVAEPVDTEALIQWLEEIWQTDEQIQEQINEEDLQKLIDSLKEQTQD